MTYTITVVVTLDALPEDDREYVRWSLADDVRRFIEQSLAVPAGPLTVVRVQGESTSEG